MPHLFYSWVILKKNIDKQIQLGVYLVFSLGKKEKLATEYKKLYKILNVYVRAWKKNFFCKFRKAQNRKNEHLINLVSVTAQNTFFLENC